MNTFRFKKIIVMILLVVSISFAKAQQTSESFVLETKHLFSPGGVCR